ncbi:MAG TPA: response regulator [Bacteroidota bacterium]|nr:response regulator [Bacteroidota bacterium]
MSTVYRKPLNVGLVAKICRVSKKTVLNWIYKDALRAFTTFGGHYRVWPGDLKKFLAQAGLDVPFQCVDERQTTFLIVDDDPTYKLILKEAILSRFPEADVIMTDDGYEALLLIGERKPDVVMLDLRMPKVDGFQVLELLRSRKKDNSMKVIVLSAYIDSEAQERLKHTITDEVWEKRKDSSELLDSLAEMLESRKIPKNVSVTHHHRVSMRKPLTHAVQ